MANERHVRRGPAWLAGPALAVVLTACGGSAGTVDPIGGGDSEPIEFNAPAAERFEETPVAQSTEPAEESEAADAEGLYSMEIPSLDLAAPVVPIASENRVLVPPHDPGVVGWWSEGAQVGAETGSAILVGHSVSTGSGVFDDIDQLAPGETVEVAGVSYAVTSVESLAQNELPSRAEELFDQSVSGRVVIVTCNDWDGTTWQSNTIAIAEPA